MFKSKLLWIAITIFGVLPPVIILFLYDYSVTGEVLSLFSKGVNASLSKDSGHWSDFGSLLSGVFTLLGAIASLATLIFLLQQQKNSEQQRLKQLQIQGEIQDKNDLHLESERSLMKFEMFKLHREMFDDVLNKIEVASAGFKFTDRNSLYKKIFPRNDFFHFEMKVNIDPASFLDIIKSRFLEQLMKLESDWGIGNNDDHILTYLIQIKFINDELGFECSEKPQEWDFLYGGNSLGINALTPWVSFVRYHNMISDILSFSGNERLKSKIHASWGTVIFESISKIALLSGPYDARRYKNFGLSCPRDKFDVLMKLISLYEICKKSRSAGSKEFQGTYSHIISTHSPTFIYEKFPLDISETYKKAQEIYNCELKNIKNHLE